MKDWQCYLAGGMSKFGKDNFEEGNKWRKRCKETLQHCECDCNVKVVNPNDYFNFAENPPTYKSPKERLWSLI